MASPTMPVSMVAIPAIIGSLGGSLTALSNTIVPGGVVISMRSASKVCWTVAVPSAGRRR